MTESNVQRVNATHTNLGSDQNVNSKQLSLFLVHIAKITKKIHYKNNTGNVGSIIPKFKPPLIIYQYASARYDIMLEEFSQSSIARS